MMEERMIIREIFENELGELLNLYKYLHSKDDPLPEDSIVKNIWQNIISNPLLKYIIADFDGEIISSCTLVIIPISQEELDLTDLLRMLLHIQIIAEKEWEKRFFNTHYR